MVIKMASFDFVYSENHFQNPITKIYSEQILLDLIFDFWHGRPAYMPYKTLINSDIWPLICSNSLIFLLIGLNFTFRSILYANFTFRQGQFIAPVGKIYL